MKTTKQVLEQVVQEADALNDKGNRLYGFILSKKYDKLEKEEQITLSQQMGFMAGYHDALEARISLLQARLVLENSKS